MIILDPHSIDYACEIMESVIRDSIYDYNLPYIPLIPSLRAYALIKTSWPNFVTEYKRAVMVAARSGQGFAYID